MISRLLTFWRKKQKKVHLLIYVVAVVVFGISHFRQGTEVKKAYSDGTFVEMPVDVYRFEMVDCQVIEPLVFKGYSEESRLIYNGDIDTLYIDCQYSYGLREFRAYYNCTGDYVFDSENSLVPKQYNQYLVYDFPDGTKQVQMYYRNSIMYLNELIINCRDHTNDYNITTSDVFMLAVLPSVIYLAVDIVCEAISKLTVKQKKK